MRAVRFGLSEGYMSFKEFWPLYMRAHRLPGTRALHYFATAIGILSAIEAVVAHKPYVFLFGIAISYGIAIFAQWVDEGNQPLIRVNAFLGAVADLRMCWLALRGRVEHEFAQHGIVVQDLSREVPVSASGALLLNRNPLQLSSHRGNDYISYTLLIVSTAGLTAGLTDLSDLFEPMEGFIHPFVQLGAPIIAFGGALVAAFGSIVAARRHAGAWANGAARGAASHAGGDGSVPLPGVEERSLRRACVALLGFGSIAFVLAEMAEHGLPEPGGLYGVISALSVVLCVVVAMFWQLAASSRFHAPRDGLADAGALALPATRGLRVDGRVQLVDVLENLISLGQRRAILAATLEAGALRPGDRVLDVGCGTGELVLAAALVVTDGGHRSDRQASGQALGIDATPGMIEIARHHAREAGIPARFELGVAEYLPLLDDSVDVVTSTFFFHHLPTDLKHAAVREMWRVLAPGGRLVITDYGRVRGLLGWIASFPMQINFHEYVRPQLHGQLERILEEEGLGAPHVARTFLGYITVLQLVKPSAQ
jgi:ubiquinone/menaquinone biosynthesis C-methylase UbiE